MSTPSPLIDRLVADMEAAMVRQHSTPSDRRRLKRLPVLAAIAAAAIVAVIVVASSDREREATPAQPGPARVDERPDGDFELLPPVPDAAQRFSTVLREADPVRDGSAAARELQQSVEEYGQDPAAFEMRQVTFGDGTTVGIGIGDRSVCLRVRMPSGAGSMGCTPASAARLDVPRVATSKAGAGVVVSGVAPDGASELQLHLPGGRQIDITPTAGFFNANVDQGPARLTYRNPDGSTGTIAVAD